MGAAGHGRSRWRERARRVIFEADTPVGKAFDLLLLIGIVASVAAVCLESVAAIRTAWGPALRIAEWVFTLLFTVEYGLRLATVLRPLRYAGSFYGVVDLLAVLPSYLGTLVPGTHALIVIRALRLLRVFRVLKLARFVGEASVLGRALRRSARKVMVFVGTVLTLVLILGTAMYLVEGGQHGFSSIPQSMYWAIVTMTTVGYGDIAPQTVLGKFVASAVMIIGYGIIAVPTGIFTVELVSAARAGVSTRACPACGRGGHDSDARFCKYCGSGLE